MYFSIFVIYGYIVYSLVYIQQKESIYANLPCWYTPFFLCVIFFRSELQNWWKFKEDIYLGHAWPSGGIEKTERSWEFSANLWI